MPPSSIGRTGAFHASKSSSTLLGGANNVEKMKNKKNKKIPIPDFKFKEDDQLNFSNNYLTLLKYTGRSLRFKNDLEKELSNLNPDMPKVHSLYTEYLRTEGKRIFFKNKFKEELKS